MRSCKRSASCTLLLCLLPCLRSDVTVTVLDRPRHQELIRQIREAGARIALISDGDVAGAIMVRGHVLLPCDVAGALKGRSELQCDVTGVYMCGHALLLCDGCLVACENDAMWWVPCNL